jgi:uncharacterized Zn ribbon protein
MTMNDKMTIKVCANEDCDNTFVQEESERFICNIGLPDYVKEESEDAAKVLCVDCNMLRLQECYDIIFVKTYETTISENIRAFTEEEFEQYEKQKNEETDGA